MPTERKSSLFFKNETKKNYNNVHYVVSSLKAIYESLDNNRREKKETKSDATKEEESKNKKCKDIRALIGLELVVDYFKRESDGDDVKSNLNNSEKNPELQTVSVE